VDYAEGSFGRVFLLKFEDKDDLLTGLKEVAVREKVRAAVVTLLGGMRSGGVVSGPREPIVPPEPMWMNFNDGREVLGMGTLFWNGDEPVLHLHGAIVRDEKATVGCIRKNGTVYLVVEAVMAEISGVNARKEQDPKTGMVALKL
jgi:predicted DNA-binding protein with PD1-like motif